MKIGTTAGPYFGAYGTMKGLEKIREHGYDTIDYPEFIDSDSAFFTRDEKEIEGEMRQIASVCEELGLEIFQTHAPWRCPPDEATPEKLEKRFGEMAKSLRLSSALGAKHFVIHCVMPFGCGDEPDHDAFWNCNLDFMGRLAGIGKQYGVVVCLENLPFPRLSLNSPADCVRFAREIGSDYFRLCLDTGHALFIGLQPGEAVRQIGGDLLAALHVHDNDGRSDRHWMPYQGIGDWKDFTAALKQVGYTGSVSLECGIPGRLPLSLRDPYERALAQTARQIAGLE